jgi:hypothetical protein
MTLWGHAAIIVLSSFALIATLTSMAIGLASAALARRIDGYAPADRAAFLFRLRLLPSACALAFSLGAALPIFLVFEPVNPDETFGKTLQLSALAGAALMARGAWRARAGWRATRAVLRDWHARGRRLDAFDAPMPVFAIDEAFPTVAVVGVTRPALFIAERVLRECTAGEVRAMVLHECAHVTHRDNFKRFLIRACPDALRRNSLLDRAWTTAAEEAADARAAGGDPAFALELAQALIRVARLAPHGSTFEMASAFYLGGSIEARVRRLVDPADSRPAPSRAAGWALAGLTLGLAAALIALSAPALHQGMEVLVRVLP